MRPGQGMLRFHLNTTSDDGAVTIKVGGELDIATAPALESALGDVFSQGDGPVELDLAEVPFIDSTGLRCLLGARRRSQESGRPLRLRGLQPRVARVLEMTGAASLFDMR